MIHADEMATVWVVRAGDRHRLVQTFLNEGVIGLGYETVPDGTNLDRTKALRHLGVEDIDPASTASASTEAAVALFLSFVRRVAVGDIVGMLDPHADGLVCGVVTGDYAYDESVDVSRHRHRRPVEWRRRLPFSELPERLEALATQRPTMAEVNDGRLRTLALACCALEAGDDPFDRPAAPVRATRTRSPNGTRAPRAPKKPPQATTAEKRCMNCFVSKSIDLFEDGGDWCRDCV